MSTNQAPQTLTPEQVAGLLRAHAAQVQAEMEALPDAALAWHPEVGEWCVNEVVGHIIEAERRGFAGRIRTLLDQDSPRFAAWDQKAVAAARGDCGRSPGEVLGEYLALRESSVRLVAGLSADQLDRSGEHERVGRLSVRDLMHEWIHHDRNHLRQLLANTQAYVWPSMRNAQLFSAD
jgi:DinB family protein